MSGAMKCGAAAASLALAAGVGMGSSAFLFSARAALDDIGQWWGDSAVDVSTAAGIGELPALCAWVAVVSGLSIAARVKVSTMRLAAVCPFCTAIGKAAEVLSAEQ